MITVGQRPADGLARVQPWLARDPVRLSVRERRRRLGAEGEAALGSNRQQEGVLFKEVEIGGADPRDEVARRNDEPLAPSGSDQTNVDVAAIKRRVYVAWEERGGIRTATSSNGGRSFSRPRLRGAGRSPSVSIGRGNSLWLAYERSDGKVVAAEGNGRAQPVAPRGGQQQQPDIAALDSDGAYVVWIDDQTGLFGAYGAIFGDVPERLDQGQPVELAEQLDNSRAPSVSAAGRQVLVAWSDFRAHQWDIYSRTSEDRGESFQPQIRVNDTPEGFEALNDSPQASRLRGDPFVVWTDFRKRSTPDESPLYDIFGARPAQRNQRLDGDGGRQVNAFAPSTAALPGGRIALAWQSNRGPTADVAMRVVANGPRRRVDDAGNRDVNSWRPSIAALAEDEVIVAWEDDRDGPSNIFYRRLALP
ncbi:MAG: hypothetical protein WKF94_04570 [Solirubrobacteraceae bacterium]